MKKFLFSIIFSLLFINSAFSQSNNDQWYKLFHQRNSIKSIAEDQYKKDRWFDYTPLILIDTIAVIDSINISFNPVPVNGLKQFIGSIIYPDSARKNGIEGGVIVTATIDTLGNTKNLEIKVKDYYGALSETALNALKNAKFTPIIKNGKPIEVQIAVAFSFILELKESSEVDTIIIHKSLCLGRCPAYTITICKNGDVTYNGLSRVEKLGLWKSKLNTYYYYGLVSLIYAVNFFNMKDEFASGTTDIPWISISVVTKERTKVVATDYYMPIKEIALLVDCLTEKLKWEQINTKD
jgi:TonB family protein